MTIEAPSRKSFTILYSIVVGCDLLLIIATSPWVASLKTTGELRANSFTEFAVSQLDLTREGVIAVWYSSILLFVTAAAAFVVWRTVPRFGFGWLITGLLIIGLSADEVAQIHEQLAPLYNVSLGTDYSTRLKVGAGDWLPILMPAIVTAAIVMMLLFLFTMRNARLCAAGAITGLLCWAGAIVAESIEAGNWGQVMSRGVEGLIEESLEVIGTTLLLISFVEFAVRTRRSEISQARANSGATQSQSDCDL